MKLFWQTGCLAFALILAGCVNFPIEGSGTPQKTNGYETIHGSYYGFKWQEYDIKKAKDYLYSAAAVLTLGLYVPQDVEWWVQALPQQDYNGPLMPSRNSK